ncbi:glycosyltransferase [Paenibacillus zeisoli]|uniref:Glycosyltransferase n=1 Tax=Paenibacillus zeisoli TaxID=2496267 RepID=A0A3S1BA30_9BACL|nr:glycosyltransferase [Paenibacillus zeisoli]
MSRYLVVWEGPVQRASGLGIASRAYVQALRRQGVDVRVGRGRRTGASGDPSRKKVLIYHHPPSQINFKLARARYDCIILNTVWETTRIPAHWLPNINKFDAICVPSRHNKQALRNSGVRVPIFIVPHGVNAREYGPGTRKLPLTQSKGRFTFVSVFGFQHRKNPEALLRAYWEEFSASDAVLLVIKTNGYAPYENEQWIKERIRRYKIRLGIHKPTAPVVVIGRHLKPGSIYGLYRLGQVFVLPTRGEGVGLPFLESLASGTPVMATAWGGHMDFLTRRNSFLVPYRLSSPLQSMNSGHSISRQFRHLFAGKGQQWAEVDIGSLKRQMRYAFQHPRLCRVKGNQGRQDMLRWTWNRAGFLMKDAIEKTLQRKK